MSYFSLGHRLPRALAVPLFGDRARFGQAIQPDDPDWLEWEAVRGRFYLQTQKRSVGKVVNDAGYRILRQVDLAGRRVLEIGPGTLEHVPQWRGRPARFALVDVDPEMLIRAETVLQSQGIAYESALLAPAQPWALPYDDAAFDLVFSFYSLEHLHPLEHYLDSLQRVLAPGGLLVGAIPCEGGLAWGVGRLLTSRRWIRRHTTLRPEKVLCWEHPNFAETLLSALDARMARQNLSFWPLGVPSVDLNLVASFVYKLR